MKRVLFEKLLNAYVWLLDHVKPRPCSFQVKDVVELKHGKGYPMIVMEVHRSHKLEQPLFYCRWYDKELKATRQNIFREDELKHFDWAVQNG